MGNEGLKDTTELIPDSEQVKTKWHVNVYLYYLLTVRGFTSQTTAQQSSQTRALLSRQRLVCVDIRCNTGPRKTKLHPSSWADEGRW